jgi:hydrogenase maturation protease
MMAEGRDAVVIGLGNVVMSDDGLGVHAVRRLQHRYRLEARVEVVEGGTAGLLLLPLLADARQVIILDAIDTGAEPGTLVRLDGEDWASAFQIGMTPHDVGLADLLGAAQLSGMWPERLALHGAQPDRTEIGTELSAPVAAVIDSLVDRVAAELANWGVPIGLAMETAPCA